MIRFLHTSDWHLGRFLHGKSLLEDQDWALKELVKLIDRQRPHAVLIAGDVFDRSLPPETAVTLFDHFLNEVAQKRGIPVCLIPGNHDSCERLGFASTLLRGRQVTIFARLSDAFSPVEIQGDNGDTALVFGIPFVEPLLMARHLENPELRTADEATQALCDAILANQPADRLKVLLCHALVVGGEVSDSEKELFIGGSSSVQSSAFDGFAYTALGHLHKPQNSGSERVRYCGSLLAYSKSEVGHRKSLTEVHLHADGKVETILHELPTLRRLRYIEGELDELVRGSHDDVSPEDYVIAGLTDRGAVLDAAAKLRARYPNLLHVSRAGSEYTSNTPALDRLRAREGLSELDLFTEFFASSTGLELSSDEKTALEQTLRELAAEERTT